MKIIKLINLHRRLINIYKYDKSVAILNTIIRLEDKLSLPLLIILVLLNGTENRYWLIDMQKNISVSNLKDSKKNIKLFTYDIVADPG